MKLIIIEGPDNCGKDSLIKKIEEQFLTCTIVHYTKPENKYIQNTIFRGYAYSIITKKYDTDVVILNRSHYGEYVYGCMYRGVSDKDAIEIISEIDDMYINNNVDAYYIQLMSTSPELLLRNEDFKSLSNGKLENISQEILRFTQIYDYSKLPKKKIIYVNDGDKFRDINEIHEEALKFIGVK